MAGERTALQLRHAQAMTTLVRHVDHAVVYEPRYDLLMRPLSAETDNLRAAMRWLTAAGRGTVAPAPLPPADAQRLAITLAAHADWLAVEADLQGDGFDFCSLARDWLDDSVPTALACRLRLSWQAQARMRGLPVGAWRDQLHIAIEGFRAVGERAGLYRVLCQL
jgi:hypothetical protein